MRRDRLVGLVAAAALALGLSACGSDDHPNQDRPPDPIEMTAKVTNQEVTISPRKIGAGLVNVTLANLSADPVELTFAGPATASGDVIAPSNVGSVKVDLAEGNYTVDAGEESSAAPDRLEVGPERPSSQNELLLP